MKRFCFLSMALLFVFSLGLFAGGGDVFTYDKAAVETELAGLTELENYVADHPLTTLSILEKENNNVLDGLSLYSPFAMGMTPGEPPLGIPSFFWGCAFGVIGVVVVYVMTDEDKEETKKSFYGCLVSTVVAGVIYGIVYSSWFAINI